MGPLEQELLALMTEATDALTASAGEPTLEELTRALGNVLASQQEAILRLAAAIDEIHEQPA